jgi:pantoate--beta-alanine ligase
VRALLREVLESEPLARVDYAEVVDAESFQPLTGPLGGPLDGDIVLPLAVRIGGTRLIDNLRLTVAG